MSRNQLPRGLAAAFCAGVVFTIACDGAFVGPEPPVIATLEISSAVDTLLDVGAASVLTAVPRDAAGQVMPTAPELTWSSSDVDVATVDAATGEVTSLSPGTVTMTATAGDATGALRLVVIDADTEGLAEAAAEPYASGLVEALAGPGAGEAAAAWAALAEGDLAGVVSAMEVLEGLAAEATDHDQAVLGVLLLYVDHMYELLNF